MPDESTVGQISYESERGFKCKIEWKVPDISSYFGEGKEDYYSSPRFEFLHSQWFLRFLSNRHTTDNVDASGFIPVYLYRDDKDRTTPQGLSFNFGVKRTDGSFLKARKDIIWLFDGDNYGYGHHKFLQIAELLEKESEFVHLRALTVSCSLWLVDDFYTTSNCDVTLKVGQETFPVHRCILAARSVVFKAMFGADVEKKGGIVDIRDCHHHQAFEDFLLFLYSGKLRINSENVFELCKISSKFCVDDLVSASIIHLMRYLSVENFCDVPIFEREFVNRALAEKLRIFFRANFGKIIRTASWQSLLQTNSRLANDLLIDMALEKKL